MPNQHNLQVISRRAQRRDERPATSRTQAPRTRIGIYTCIRKVYYKGPELKDESNVTPVTKRSTNNFYEEIYRKRSTKSTARRRTESEDLERVIVQKIRNGSIEVRRRAKKDEQRVARTM